MSFEAGGIYQCVSLIPYRGIRSGATPHIMMIIVIKLLIERHIKPYTTVLWIVLHCLY